MLIRKVESTKPGAYYYRLLPLLLPSVRAHTFYVLICSNSFWKFAATISNLQQLYSICSNFILFAATLFYLQQGFLICSNFILFAACPLWATVAPTVTLEKLTFHVNFLGCLKVNVDNKRKYWFDILQCPIVIVLNYK